MRNILFILLTLSSLACSRDKATPAAKFDIPTRNHHLSYIPYNANFDKPDYMVCDSTKINSGRSRLKYAGGTDKLKEDITSGYLYRQEYASFSGYVVLRFLVNCEGQAGRYRAQSLNLDFSPSDAPPALLSHSIELVKSLDDWTKSPEYDDREEYSKFINLKIENGKIQHVLL